MDHLYTTLQGYGYPMEHSGRASQPKDHNVNPTGLAVLPNIKNVEKQKCHDDFQTKRNGNPATPENCSLELECTTFHGHVEKSTLVQRTYEKLPLGTRG